MTITDRLHGRPPEHDMSEASARAALQARLVNGLRIEFHQHDWVPGWAAFRAGLGKDADSTAFCVINLGSMLSAVACGSLSRAELPYFIAECMMHEIMHAIEEWAGAEFDEERIERLLDLYRERYADETASVNEALIAAPNAGRDQDDIDEDLAREVAEFEGFQKAEAARMVGYFLEAPAREIAAAIHDEALNDILLRAENALEAVTEQCGGSCAWINGGSEDCLCSKVFQTISALRDARTPMAPL